MQQLTSTKRTGFARYYSNDRFSNHDIDCLVSQNKDPRLMCHKKSSVQRWDAYFEKSSMTAAQDYCLFCPHLITVVVLGDSGESFFGEGVGK